MKLEDNHEPLPEEKIQDLIEKWKEERKLRLETINIIKKTWPLLLKALRTGHTRTSAQRMAGMAQATFHNHYTKIPEFAEAVEEAEALAIDDALQSIKDNLDDPKVAMWFLERKDKAFQAPQRVDFTTNDQAIIFTFEAKDLKPVDDQELE